ncbi:unnamed protein product [Callosobruchus maculatus]|uniref:Gustatory receptor n=1 Tax=Callosobruchus maculatus TaxID=64391 RepID=A0A653BL88_CALMS|nr:unnamed protein product [Callosobruchus maculatus]
MSVRIKCLGPHGMAFGAVHLIKECCATAVVKLKATRCLCDRYCDWIMPAKEKPVYALSTHDVDTQMRLCICPAFLSMQEYILAFIITITQSCDATEKEGERFTNLCFTTYINETNKNLKKQYKNLAVISQKIGPKFSAAGFFTINQMFLSTFFSTLTSYAIVCIQFSTL